MSLDYNKVWSTLNELEMVTSKISSAREIIDSAIDALENHNGEKAETLMYAADEFLKYYLADFDEKFKDAWKETVVKIKQPTQESLNKDWEEFYYPEEYKTHSEMVESGYEMTDDGFWIPPQSSQKEDKVVKWRLPVEMDGPSGEYFITFPDDLMEAAELKEGDEVEWVDQGDGSLILRKLPYDPYRNDMIAAGYKMVNGKWEL